MSKLNVIITGSTGMVGKGALLECIDSAYVESILLVNRNPVDIKNTKIKEVLVSDFSNLDSVREDLKGYNACFFCLGITSVGMNEAEYTKVMYDLPVSFARQIHGLNPEMTFCFVSGAGTDSTGEGKTMWARVKGKAENEILQIGFQQAYMFRPGFIRPLRGIRSRTKLYNAIYSVVWPLAYLLQKFPKFATTTTVMGQAMINVALNGYPKTILESEDINKAGKG